MLRLICFLFYTTLLLPCSAQDTGSDDVIAMLPFKASNSSRVMAAELVEAVVFETILDSKQVELVERQAFADLENEKWRQSGSDFEDGVVIEKTRSVGANKMMVGTITLCDVTSKRLDSGNYSYDCGLQVSVRLIDLETSKVVASESWEAGTGLMNLQFADSEKKAIAQSAKKINLDVRKFLAKYYPMRGEILQVTAGGDLILNLGSSHGIDKNDRLIVYTTAKVAGADYNEEIGEIKIDAVNGTERSTGKMKKGKIDIKQGLTSGVKFYVKTK